MLLLLTVKGVEERLAARLAVSAANPERYRFLEPDLQGIQTVYAVLAKNYKNFLKKGNQG